MKAICGACAVVQILLAGCGPTNDAGPPGNTAVAEANYQQQLQAMPEGQRNAVFIRAIRDARLDCQHVEGSTAAGDYRGMPVWNVRCSGGGNWTIVVAGNGVAQILNASEARLVGQDAGNSQ